MFAEVVLAVLEEETVEILTTQIMVVQEVVVVSIPTMIVTEVEEVAHIEDLVAAEEMVDLG